jgi:putative tryptophan/tyrosine transport system substrate-binding protein
MMRRRQFITLLGGATAAWPLAARAQRPGNVYRIAIVRPSGSAADMADAIENPSYFALFKELRRLGYVERQNLIVERYSGEGRRERHDEVAREVVRTNPHLIIAVSNPLVLIFKGLTNAIPIIGVMADPVAYGVVANLARPGGNVTGASVDARLETWAKRIQVMQEVIPTAAKVGYLNLRSSWDLAQGRYSMNRRRDCLNKPNGVSRGSLLGSHRTLISHAVRRISKRRGSASIG